MNIDYEYREDDSCLEYARDIVNEQLDSFICGELNYDNYVDLPEESWEYYD